MPQPTARENDVVNRGRRARWWRRIGTKETGFRYETYDGKPLRSPNLLERIKTLVIPPAWQDVHISPSPRSRLQAIGLDGTGRPQYLYNESFTTRQERRKFEKIERFGEYLPRLREVTSQHLALDGFSKERILALMTRLVNGFYFRAGSEFGAKTHKTYGVTTLRSRHVRVESGGVVRFSFDGKHHVHHRRVLVDQHLAAAITQLKGLHGRTLFQYLNGDGSFHPLSGHDLNQYVKSLTAPEFSVKDFRTWHGTLLVAQELAKIGKASTKRELKTNIVQAIKRAAEQLGNTPAVCRRSYLHPTILMLYERGITLQDVPIDTTRIESTQAGHQPQELQLLELFHVGRVLRAQRGRKPILSSTPTWTTPPQPVPAAS